MAVGYKNPRGTRAGLNTKATAGQLDPGQIYMLTDESRLAVALTTTAYQTFVKEGENNLLSIFCSGKPLASEVIGGGVAPYSMTLNAASCVLISRVAFTSSTVFIIQRAGTQIGTATFSAGATAAVFSFTQTNITSGQTLDVVNAATADATGADLRGYLRAV